MAKANQSQNTPEHDAAADRGYIPPEPGGGTYDEVAIPKAGESADRELTGWLMGLSVMTRETPEGLRTVSAAAMIYIAGSIPNKWGPMALKADEGGGSIRGVKAMSHCFKVALTEGDDIRRIELALEEALNADDGGEVVAFPRPVLLRVFNEKPVADARNPETRCSGKGIKIGRSIS